MSMQPRNKLQPPFRHQDLLGLSQFIRYCRDEGVDTSEGRLEYYDKENLLLPAVRINRGFVEYRKVLVEHGGRLEWQFVFRDDLDRIEHKKVDRHSYYYYGDIVRMDEGWLDEYKKRGLVEYPAETEFREWETYKEVCPETSASAYFTEIPRPSYETFYSRLQIFPLRVIQNRLVLHLMDGDLFAQDEDWIQWGKNVREMFAGVSEILQRGVLRYYETFRLLHDILDLRAKMINEAHRQYETSLKEYMRDRQLKGGEAEKEASLDAWDRIRSQEADTIPPKAKSILKKSSLSPEEIEKRREEFAYLGFTVDPTHGSSICFNRAIRRTLEAASRQFRFAYHCYAIANYLGWLLRRGGESPPTLEKLHSGIDRLKFCAVCQRPFIPKRRNDVTCGDEECIGANRKKHTADWKRKRRKKV